MDSKCFRFLRTLFIVCFSLAVILVTSVYYPMIGVGLLLCAVAFLCCKYEIPRFALMLFCFSFLVHLAVMVCISSPIQSDYLGQYEAAKQFAAGDFSFQEKAYFRTWGYQTGLVIYEGLLLKIWNSPQFLRLINCFVSSGTNLLIYLMAKDCYSKHAAQIVSIAYAVSIFPATLVVVLSNSIPSAFFLYLAVFLIVGKRFEKYPRPAVYAAAGACLALGNALRPDAPVVLVPLAVYFLFRILSKFTLKNFLYYGKRALALFLTYAVLLAGLSGLVKITGVNAAGLGNNDPLWGFVVGTNQATEGRYNDADATAIHEMMEEDATRAEASKRLIGQHLSGSPVGWVQLLVQKIEHFWWDRGLYAALCNIKENYPPLFAWLEKMDRAMFTWILLLSVVGAAALFRDKKKDFKLYLFPFIFFAAFFVYLILEVQPRYAYTVQIALFVLAAGGAEALPSIAAALKKLPNRPAK